MYYLSTTYVSVAPPQKMAVAGLVYKWTCGVQARTQDPQEKTNWKRSDLCAEHLQMKCCIDAGANCAIV